MADSYNLEFDRWSSSGEASDPARHAVAVTPNDTEDITNAATEAAPLYAKALYIGVTGNVAVIMAGDATGTAVTFSNVPVGFMPIQVRRVMATNTTATGIVALLD
jgi:hypothetical protein